MDSLESIGLTYTTDEQKLLAGYLCNNAFFAVASACGTFSEQSIQALAV